MHGMAALLARYNINAPSLFYYYYDFPNLTSCCCCCLTLTYSQHLFCLIKYIVRWTATPAAAPPVCPWNKCSTETLIKSSPLVLLPPTTITVKSRKIVTSVQIFLATHVGFSLSLSLKHVQTSKRTGHMEFKSSTGNTIGNVTRLFWACPMSRWFLFLPWTNQSGPLHTPRKRKVPWSSKSFHISNSWSKKCSMKLKINNS
jgi:hypothetical protein